MSRNLTQTGCAECPGGPEHIELEEPPRPVADSDIPLVYRKNYAGLIVAHAHCTLCHTLYIAWVDWPSSPHSWWHLKTKDEGARFCDLSYRHAFNDEPCVLDLPVYRVEAVVTYKRTPYTLHPYFNDRNPEDTAAFKARWERTVNEAGQRQSNDSGNAQRNGESK